MSRVFSFFASFILICGASTVGADGHRHHRHRAVPLVVPSIGSNSMGSTAMAYGWGDGRGYGGYAGLSDFNGIPYYGYGYAYDPYRHGSFRAPDLLDEPYFRAQHKFDSQFPGRYSGRPRLQMKSAVPIRRYP